MFDFLEDLLRELKEVPGLGALRRLHTMLLVKRTRFRNRFQDLNNRKNSIANYSDRVRRMTKKSKGAKRRDD